MTDREHFVQFYDDDAVLADSASRFLCRGLAAGAACIVVATQKHRTQLDIRLRANGFDLDDAIKQGQYVPLDAPSLLAQLMVGGAFDLSKIEEVVWPVIAQAKLRYSRVYAFGEMVALLSESGDHEAAIALEKLWDQVAGPHQLSLFCAYPRRVFRTNDYQVMERICAQHSQVVP
jgi:hypothetical protein